MLPLPHDYAPMEAKIAARLPEGDGWYYEPKWDGFRCLAFRDGKEIELRSKSGQPLGRYFPELEEALLRLEPERFVLDGEIVTVVDSQISFDHLLQRIHPAESRIKKLSREFPATYVLFDLLTDSDGSVLTELPLSQRRTALEEFAGRFLEGQTTIELSPMTTELVTAKSWLHQSAIGIDGVMAKRSDLAYLSGERTGMQKVKHIRTVDCVVGGFRYATKGKVVGSLLLGLYDDAGLLHHVGFCSAFSDVQRIEITRMVEPLIEPPGFTGKAPGGPSRWSTERSTQWEPLRTEMVIEVQYDHFSGDRFRHGTRFVRFRPDKKPRACSMDQLNPPSGGGEPFMPGAAVVKQ